MSRYQQIRDAWRSSRDQELANRDACFAFVGRLVAGLVDYLEIPDGHVKLVPADGSSGGEASVAAASTPDGDGTWCTGLRISIADELSGTPTLDARLVLYARRSGDAISLRLYRDGESIEIPDAPDADLTPALEFVFRELMRWLRAS